MELELIITKGLPASGKSFWAKEQVKLSKSRIKRVNKDDLRKMINAGIYKHGKNERQILETERIIVEKYLSEGSPVIVDNTHFNPIHETFYRNLALKYKANFYIKDFTDVPVELCIQRDIQRADGVGERVIRQMWRQNLAVPKKYKSNGKQRAIIFDIDGTLAEGTGRNMYDFHKVDTDSLVEPVAILLDIMAENNFKILIFSGRMGDEKCLQLTKDWLKKHKLVYDELEMRADQDTRPDFIVKKEFYNKHKNNYDIQYAVDDRLQVCRLWHELGLTLLKVGDPDLEF